MTLEKSVSATNPITGINAKIRRCLNCELKRKKNHYVVLHRMQILDIFNAEKRTKYDHKPKHMNVEKN